jgi:hypothetical protein
MNDTAQVVPALEKSSTFQAHVPVYDPYIFVKAVYHTGSLDSRVMGRKRWPAAGESHSVRPAALTGAIGIARYFWMARTNVVDGTIGQRGSGVEDLFQRTSRMIEESLDFSVKRLDGAEWGVVTAQVRDGRLQALDYFRHSLAVQVAKYLGEAADGVVAVYRLGYDESEDELGRRPEAVALPINLVLHVRRRTEAHDSLVAGLDKALLVHYRALFPSQAGGMSSFLAVQFVDDEDVAKDSGFAAAIGSVYGSSTRLWPR